MPTAEHHRIFRANWLRAAVLGANDGIVSTASLITGVAAAQTTHEIVLTSGVAALVAGALSMAAGEYVSVHSQADIEAADLRIEQSALKTNSAQELQELTDIYTQRGVAPEIARTVAEQLTRHDALDAHARDELGISAYNRAQPVQAAVASAASFAGGAALPLAVAALTPITSLIPAVIVASVISLGILGAIAARAGGAPMGLAALRVTVLGAAAMALTAGVGALFNVAV
ncbi:VIT1/CCC1 transporter family protein [Bordetella avium]|uniref:Membrane protein n=4 Tax=Bordetella avium TaxID=521 RepID=Q2L110_BORA1|nr:VIT family protein [Bordetella avium]AZY49135.1 VIT family protein [Bordetella avium]AZY52493.1 VIT family protein [Bordetella avium]RIQ12286.1 VIT family protein [Bordetella avium]RIQ19342.1 VIT family protein [Bordetella avium]RIQ33511.1 VIT family protein [Bordetella avium]